jgi:hypothetical protein
MESQGVVRGRKPLVTSMQHRRGLANFGIDLVLVILLASSQEEEKEV